MKNEDILKNEIKREFPKMPETMRKMVEEEVGRQIKIERPEFSSKSSETVMTRGRKWSMKKTAIVALAATMALGTTVFAGTKLYEIYSEKEGSYGLKTGIQVDVSQDSTEGGSGETNGEISGSDSYGKVPAEIPVVDIKINAIPEDMEAAEGEPGKLHRKDTPYQGGISMSTVAMDNEATKDQLELLDTNVVKSENMTIAGHDAVYMEKYNSDNIGITFDKKFYIVYPEVWHVLEVFVGEDMTKEEAVKVIESIELVPTGEMTDAAEAYTWSDMIAGQNGTEEIPGEAINVEDDKLTATAEEMKNVHKVGEAFSVNGDAETAEGEPITILAKDNLLTARVKEVQVADDLSLLGDSEHIEDSWKDAVGADGKLVPNTIQYI
ncbi:MAG: DUF4367 domain-containing protein, partial [Clostridia bacterium]|nr:DUF4367 domain-containing protein [Clostridia bacterium]